MRPSGMAQRRSFLVLERGEIDGTSGYWAEDEDDGAEGFLEALEDVFWVYDDVEYTWYQRRFQGRHTRRGKGKGKRKGKGRGGRRYFKPRRSKGRDKGRRKGRLGHRRTVLQGWVWLFPEERQRKARQERQGQPQTSSTPAIQNHQRHHHHHHHHHQQQQQQQQQAHYSTAASSSGHGIVSFCEPNPARLSYQNRETGKRFPVWVGEVEALQRGLQRRPDPVCREVGLQPGEASWKPWEKGTSFFTAGYSDQTEMPDQFECSEQTEVPSDKKIGNSNQIERPAQHECSGQTQESTEKDGVFSFHIKQVDARENGLSFHTENSAPPTVCILDLGCTRAMGSRKAVDAFCRYVGSHPNSGLWYEIQTDECKIFLRKLSAIQVHRENCHIHLWPWMEYRIHRVRHCRRRWCPIVDTSTDEESWIPIWTYSWQSLLVLCKNWHEKNGLEDSDKYSSSPGLARCCMVFGSSEFQDSTSQEFLFTTWSSTFCLASLAMLRLPLEVVAERAANNTPGVSAPGNPVARRPNSSGPRSPLQIGDAVSTSRPRSRLHHASTGGGWDCKRRCVLIAMWQAPASRGPQHATHSKCRWLFLAWRKKLHSRCHGQALAGASVFSCVDNNILHRCCHWQARAMCKKKSWRGRLGRLQGKDARGRRPNRPPNHSLKACVKTPARSAPL